jgi:PKD repeat protein
MTRHKGRRAQMLLAGVLTAGVLLPSTAGAAFTGTKSYDAETGNTSQFVTTEVEQGSASTKPYAKVISKSQDPAHVAQGNYSIEYYMPPRGKRVENPDTYDKTKHFSEGQEVWIARQQFIDPNNWAEQGWNAGHHTSMQIKTDGPTGGGPFAMDDRDNRWTWGPNGATEVISAPVTKGKWEKWLYYFKFSSDKTKGRMTIWRDGVKVYDATRATLNGYTAYYKQGIYQSTSITKASRMWIDGTTISTDRAAAERGAWGNAAPAPAPEPTPALSTSFSYAPSAPVAGQAVQFDGDASRDVVRYDWSLDGATQLTGEKPAFTFQNPGTKNVTLTVTTADGKKASTTKTITVAAKAAETALAASFTYGPTPVVAKQTTVQFNGSANRDVVRYDWSLDGVTQLTGKTPTFKFANPGNKNVTLTVTAADGKKASTTKTITVK